IAAHLHPVARSLEASDDVGRSHGLRFSTSDPRPHAKQTVGRFRSQLPVVWDAVREDVAHRNLESDREEIEAREHILGRRPARAMRVTFIVSVPPVSCQSSSLPPPRGSVGLGAASGSSLFLNSTRYTTLSFRLAPWAMWNS